MHKITGIWIEDIEKIEVTEPETPENRCMQAHDHHLDNKGEKVELILEAESTERLEFKKPDDSWLTPKVYKGRKEEDSSRICSLSTDPLPVRAGRGE